MALPLRSYGKDVCGTCEGLKAVPKCTEFGVVYVGCPECDPAGEYIKAACDPDVPLKSLNEH